MPQDGCRATTGVMVPVQPDANSIMKAVVSADFSSECKNYPAEPGSVEEMTRAEQARWLTPFKKEVTWTLYSCLQPAKPANKQQHRTSGLSALRNLTDAELLLNFCTNTQPLNILYQTNIHTVFALYINFPLLTLINSQRPQKLHLTITLYISDIQNMEALSFN